MICVLEIGGELRFLEFPFDSIQEGQVKGFLQLPNNKTKTFTVVNKQKVVGFFSTAEECAHALFMGSMAGESVQSTVEDLKNKAPK